jgi:hypothetical protein
MKYNTKDTIEMLLGKPKLQLNLLLPSFLSYCEEFDKLTLINKNTSTNLENYVLYYFQTYYKNLKMINNLNGSKLIKSVQDASIYHIYIWLLCKYSNRDVKDGTVNEEYLINALEIEYNVSKGKLPVSSSDINSFIDYDFIIRQCISHGCKKSLIYCYSFLGYYEEAVNQAINTDINIAKVTL